MIDLLSLIGTVYNQRQRAADSAAQQRQFGQELAFRGAESAADRALRQAEQERNLALEREQLGARTAESAADRAARLAEQERQLALDRERLAQSGSQFGQELGQRGSQFSQTLAQQKATEAARQALQEKELLGQLATSTGSYDILDLLGRNLGIPQLGALMRNQNSSRTVAPSRAGSVAGSTAGLPYRGGQTWDMISGYIPTPGPTWASWLQDNPANSGVLAAPPRTVTPRRY